MCTFRPVKPQETRVCDVPLPEPGVGERLEAARVRGRAEVTL